MKKRLESQSEVMRRITRDLRDIKGIGTICKDVEEISKKAIEILARYEVGDRYLTNLTRFLIHRTH